MLDFFNSVEHLEPKCPKCESKIIYGETTRFDDKKECHVCINCSHQIK